MTRKEACNAVRLVVLGEEDVERAGSIAAIREHAWKGNPSSGDLERAARKVADEIRRIDPGRKALLAACSGLATIGFCRVAADAVNGSLWWIGGVAVHQEWRRRGVGRGLLRGGGVYAGERGASLVRSTTDPWNAAAIRCHERAGFMNDGQFTAEDGDRKIGFSIRTEAIALDNWR
ncbi:MAG: GNAT family N-acetyltransferase [Candidatus Brocadiaceae bacterium]|nr:GNAT family N-acetyltransferase [Candidatus Brocadiaceae bacterium]